MILLFIPIKLTFGSNSDDDEQIRYCGWGTTGNALVFVHKCNVYFVPKATQHTNYYLITGNGVPKKVYMSTYIYSLSESNSIFQLSLELLSEVTE